jgi:GH24 family phage-related lysozyme (muramidase)
MHASVLARFPSFTAAFEGRIPFFYQDILGLVTIGLGCLVDPQALATCLPMRHHDGRLASPKEIGMEWNRIKSDKTLAKKGHRAAAQMVTLHLAEADIDKLASNRLATFEKYLMVGFPEWETFPADAQLGICSMAWAMGPGFYRKFPNFTKACNERRWEDAAKNCLMRTTGNPGLVPRNKANVKLFYAAAAYPDSTILRGD